MGTYTKAAEKEPKKEPQRKKTKGNSKLGRRGRKRVKFCGKGGVKVKKEEVKQEPTGQRSAGTMGKKAERTAAE